MSNNQIIVYYLKKLIDENIDTNPDYNINSFRQAIDAIVRNDSEIKTILDANGILGISPKIMKYINQALNNIDDLRLAMLDSYGRLSINIKNRIMEPKTQIMTEYIIEESEEPVDKGLIISYLVKLRDMYKAEGDIYRSRAYARSVSIIEKHQYKINSGDDALKIRGIGKGIAEKIDEIIKTGKLDIVDCAINNGKSNTETEVLSLFSGIFGVGPITAKKWYSEGYRSLDEIRCNAELTSQQRIGLMYYSDLQKKIPRMEIRTICDKIEMVLIEMSNNYHMTVCGSYRRGESESGDIDILITHKTGQYEGQLEKIVKALREYNILISDLSLGETKYMGICRLSRAVPVRRIDIRMVPKESWITSLLYFTGSAELNKKMRLRAMELKYKLNEHGLYNLELGKQVPINSEKQVFDILGITYLDPIERNLN